MDHYLEPHSMSLRGIYVGLRTTNSFSTYDYIVKEKNKIIYTFINVTLHHFHSSPKTPHCVRVVWCMRMQSLIIMTIMFVLFPISCLSMKKVSWCQRIQSLNVMIILCVSLPIPLLLKKILWQWGWKHWYIFFKRQ